MKKIWLWLLDHRPHLRVRTVMLCIVAVLVLLTPTVLALASVYLEPVAPEQTLFSVSIYDKDRVLLGTEQASENPEEGATVADILYRAIAEAKKAAFPPFDPEDGTPLYITANHNDVVSEYTFYFSVLNHASFYLDTEGQCFLIGETAERDFLCTTYAESLYNRSEPPVLYTNLQHAVTPSAVSWYYQTTSDSFRPSSSAAVTDRLMAYEFSGALSLSFSEEPDVCSVRVIANGSLIYEGNLTDLGDITADESTALRIHVDARWDSSDGSFYYGELSYDFEALIVDRATFSLDRHALHPGEFLILTCRNVREPSQMTLVSDVALTTTFYRFDGMTYCVIPYPDELAQSAFSFTVTYGASCEDFTVSLSPASAPEAHTLNREDADLKAAMSPSAQSMLDELPSTLPAPSDNTLYFRGNTSALSLGEYSVSYRFGDLLSSSDLAAQAKAIGNHYRTDAYGVAVSTVMAGEVLVTGYCDALGYYAVVNHGLGLYTWYAHLSTVDVRAGDIVAIGQAVGKTGTGGVSDAPGFLLACTVGDRWCDPDAALYHNQ